MEEKLNAIFIHVLMITNPCKRYSTFPLAGLVEIDLHLS